MLQQANATNRYLRRIFISAVGIVYVLLMFKLLFLRPQYEISYQYNLVPLKTIKQYINNREYFNLDIWIKNLFGNIIMFIPIGLLLPLLNQRMLKIFKFTGTAMAILFSVELVQMLLRVGSFDVDDIILNTLGALIGLVFTRVVIMGK
jgi:glycopeptide antibiotics resistance protein